MNKKNKEGELLLSSSPPASRPRLVGGGYRIPVTVATLVHFYNGLSVTPGANFKPTYGIARIESRLQPIDASGSGYY